jgi:hypothetical protein
MLISVEFCLKGGGRCKNFNFIDSHNQQYEMTIFYDDDDEDIDMTDLGKVILKIIYAFCLCFPHSVFYGLKLADGKTNNKLRRRW